MFSPFHTGLKAAAGSHPSGVINPSCMPFPHHGSLQCQLLPILERQPKYSSYLKHQEHWVQRYTHLVPPQMSEMLLIRTEARPREPRQVLEETCGGWGVGITCNQGGLPDGHLCSHREAPLPSDDHTCPNTLPSSFPHP